jgi:hypothetical protein
MGLTGAIGPTGVTGATGPSALEWIDLHTTVSGSIPAGIDLLFESVSESPASFVFNSASSTQVTVPATGHYKVSWNARLNNSCTLGVIINGTPVPPLQAGSSGGPVQATSIINIQGGALLTLRVLSATSCSLASNGPVSGDVTVAMTIVRVD